MNTVSIDEVTGKTGYSLQKILKLQQKATLDLADSIGIEKVKRIRLNGSGFIAMAVSDNSDYIVIITGLDTLTLKENDSGLKFSCNCPKFKFYYERALNFHGLAAIKFSNGENPDIRNPNYERVPEGIQVCKHLVAFIQYLLNLKKVR